MMKKITDAKSASMKISMIEPVGGHGGNEFYDFGLCEALRKYCDISLYTCSETTLHEKYNLKTKTYKFYKNIYGDTSTIARGLKYIFGTFRSIVNSKKNHVSIAHVHIYHFAWRELVVVFLCKITFMKVVATIHDVESFSENPGRLSASLKFIKFFPFIDRYIVHSRYAAENLQKISHGTIKKRLHIVPHGDTDFLYAGGLNKINVRKELMLSADKKIILFFGQIKQVKGLDVLLNAFAELSKADSSYHLLITGRPWKIDGQVIRDKISKMGMTDRITLNMAYIKNEDVPKYFVSADLVVLPYLKIYSSGVLLRALDYGTPVIVSDLPALTDVICDGENGRVFRTGDYEHLTAVIKNTFDTPLLLKKLAHAGKQTIADRYSWDAVARETMAVYNIV